MTCRDCGRMEQSVLETRHLGPGLIVRRRQCDCGARWTTEERIRRGSHSSPIAGKSDSGCPPVVANLPTGSGQACPPVGVSETRGISILPSLDLVLSGSPDLSKPNNRSPNIMSRRKRSAVAYSPDFLAFWELYPKKQKKSAAARAWANEQPDLEVIRAALAWQTVSPDWTKEGGQFIPLPASYINGQRWEDEPTRTRVPSSKNGAMLAGVLAGGKL